MVSSPGPDGAVALQGQGVIITAAYGDDAGKETRRIIGITDRYRPEPVRQGAVTKLAELVEPPGPDGAVALEGEKIIALAFLPYCRIWVGRQQHSKCTAPTFLAFHFHTAVVGLHYHFTLKEADSHPVIFRGLKWLKKKFLYKFL